MLIPAVEDGLEALLRDALPLPDEVGDVSFEAPSGTWAAQVNRITVNLFLYGVARSSLPPRPASTRPGADGELERRPSLPMVQLSYLVSAWAGVTRDEHQLLGDVMTRLISHQAIPAHHLPSEMSSSVLLSMATDETNRPRDLWGALGGTLKASFTLLVTVASDAYGWEVAPPGVTAVEGLASPVPSPTPAPRTGAGARTGGTRTGGTRTGSPPRPATEPAARSTRREGGGVVRSAVSEGGTS